VKPTILLATTCNWVSPARLAIALTSAGFDVKAVCPAHNYLNKISVLHETYRYSALRPLSSFRRAIAAAKPDLLLPCDDLATRHLHEVHRRSTQDGDSRISELIARSLGTSQNFALLDARTPLMRFAQKEGIRTPNTQVIASLDELEMFLQKANFPLVLKADGTSSGEGVAIVNSPDESRRAFRLLQSPPKLVRTLKWVIVNHNFRPVLPTLLRRKSVVNVQSYKSGREATSLIACWYGKVLAELQFEVLCVQKAGGPASILKLICNTEMSQTAVQIASGLQLSGLYGFDFILENGTEQAYLIEMNPRTTQVGHLALGPGRDLPASLYAAVTGTETKPTPKITEKDVIVLFPEGWLRSPNNTFLKTGYHDVPWEEPDLVRSLVDRRNQLGTWLSKQKWLRLIWGPRLPRL
jgi:Phosphoribosylglycinamide synthetase, ATP-grasp (A) domain